MTFAADNACRSLAVRLDMLVPSLKIDTPTIRREAGLRYCHKGTRFMPAGPLAVTKKRAGFPRLAAAHPLWGQGYAWCYDGIRTVSTTWITPLDWLTFGIVTVEEPPLASMIITVSPERLTVS